MHPDIHRVAEHWGGFVIPVGIHRLRIYFASCVHHAELAKEVKETWTNFDWTMQWPWMVGKFPEYPQCAAEFWRLDERNVRQCDVVMLYAQPNDTLRGALVEAGMGIALEKRVLLVGENAGFGTWQWHPRVGRASDLREAFGALVLMAMAHK